MRVIPSMISRNAIQHIQLQNAEVLQRQTQLTTGLRFQKPSDDPIGWSEMAGIQRQLNVLESEGANLLSAESRLNARVSSLQNVTDILVRAKQIALEANQATDEAERNGLATEVDHLIERLLQTANSQSGGDYYYSGASSATQPFELRAANAKNEVAQVIYHGSGNPTETLVSASIRVQTGRVGEEVFVNRERGPTIFIGRTGALPGGGTDSGVGRASLLLRHQATTYAAGSGIAPGTRSADGDTILGQSGTHSVRIIDLAGDGSFGTVSLNGGQPVEFTNVDADLRVYGPNHESIFVDTTNITAGFDGNIDLAAAGEISIDGGASFSAIDFTSSQTLIHSVTGGITHVDTSGAVRSGTEQVEYTGSADVFTALLELRQDIRNERNLASDQLTEAFARRIGDLDRGVNHIVAEIGRDSADLEDMSILQERNGDIQLQFKSLLAERTSVDYAEVVSELQQSLNLLQFTYSASTTILQQSILDYF